MNLTPEQQEALLSIARDIAAMGISVYGYSDRDRGHVCLFCDVTYIYGQDKAQDLAHHKADCTYLKACNLLKSLSEN